MQQPSLGNFWIRIHIHAQELDDGVSQGVAAQHKQTLSKKWEQRREANGEGGQEPRKIRMGLISSADLGARQPPCLILGSEIRQISRLPTVLGRRLRREGLRAPDAGENRGPQTPWLSGDLLSLCFMRRREVIDGSYDKLE